MPFQLYKCKKCNNEFSEINTKMRLVHAETELDPAEYSAHCPACGTEVPDDAEYTYRVPDSWFKGWKFARNHRFFYRKDYAVTNSFASKSEAIYTGDSACRQIIGTADSLTEAKRLCWLHSEDLL